MKNLKKKWLVLIVGILISAILAFIFILPYQHKNFSDKDIFFEAMEYLSFTQDAI